ncbi:hypothetical protein ACT3CE_02770 [Marinifilum sp. RC60d5]|uniref:hypothetical protein n=1 Tax=Marinifilum sp. RC60d5 TaxID=3458414 RepID=UPI004035918A
MKNLKFLFSGLALALLISCGGGNKVDDKLGKMEVEIPAELKDNKEVVEFIVGMSEVADEYALMIDETMEDVGEYVGVDESELGMIDQLKLVKATAQIAVKSTTIMGKWGEYMDKRSQLGEQLSDEELVALEIVWTRFEKRMEQIQAKYGEIEQE